MSNARIVLAIGAIAVLGGLALTAYQMFMSLPAPNEMHGANLSPGQFSLQTHFPGILVMGIGAVLLIVGGFVGRRSN
jgi:hypothetical protein